MIKVIRLNQPSHRFETELASRLDALDKDPTRAPFEILSMQVEEYEELTSTQRSELRTKALVVVRHR